MGLFSKKKNNAPSDSINLEDEILGFLDEIIALRKSIEVSILNVSLQCNLYSLDEKKGLLVIDQKIEFDKFNEKSANCGFSLDNSWFSFPSKLIIINNKQYIKMPNYIVHKDRRQFPRTKFVAREAVSVSIIESFGKGIGVTGKAISISEAGINASIIRAVNLSDEKEIRPSQNLFEPNKKVMLVRVKNIPGVREFDADGFVKRVTVAGGSKIAINFNEIPGAAKKELKLFISSRIREFKLFKRSRKKRHEIEKKQKLVSENQETKEETNSISKPNTITIKPSPEKAKPFTVLAMGDVLLPHLSFLGNMSHCQWIQCKNPLELSKNLRKESPSFLVLPYTMNNNNMLDYLKKLYTMNVLNKVEIVILNSQPINTEDISKCKLLGIKYLLEIPLKDPQSLTRILK